MYKLVAVDLDGTLLDSKNRISAVNAEAIRRAERSGTRVVLCSGRIYKGVRVFSRQLGLRGPAVACNGAIIRDLTSGETLLDEPLSLPDCIRIAGLCHDYGLYFHAYANDVLFAERLANGAAFYHRVNPLLPPEDRIEIRIVEDMKALFEREGVPASKIVVVADQPALLAEVRSLVESLATVEAVSSGSDNFEVIKNGVGKGYALAMLSEILGIEKDEIIAIGDNENDDSMIRYAGLGVAMGNADNRIKALADYVTCSNDEDGVARVLTEFVL